MSFFPLLPRRVSPDDLTVLIVHVSGFGVRPWVSRELRLPRLSPVGRCHLSRGPHLRSGQWEGRVWECIGSKSGLVWNGGGVPL